MSYYADNQSELIYLFLDGEIDSTQQTALFAALAQNNELQTELQQALEIKRGFSSDKRALGPSAILTASLFDKAGIANPFGTPAQSPQAAPVGSKAGFMSGISFKSLSPLLYFLSGVALTGLLLFSLGIFDSNDENINYSNSGTANPASDISRQNKLNNISDVPYIGSKEKAGGNNGRSDAGNADSPAIMRKARVVIIRDTVYVNSVSQSEDRPSPRSDAFEFPPADPVYDSRIVSAQLNSSSIFDRDSRQVTTVSSLGEPMKIETPISLSTGQSLFLVEMRSSQGIYYAPERFIAPTKSTLFSNGGMNLYYKINDNHYLGAGIGKEQLQMYKVQENGDILEFDLVPSMNWYGVNYRYAMDGIPYLGNLRPFAGAILAGTRFGLMGKGMAGFMYNPEDLFTFSIGLEGTTLVYELRSQTKATYKLGMVFNFGLNF